MLELEDNKKELQELFNKLEEIGESLCSRKVKE